MGQSRRAPTTLKSTQGQLSVTTSTMLHVSYVRWTWSMFQVITRHNLWSLTILSSSNMCIVLWDTVHSEAFSSWYKLSRSLKVIRHHMVCETTRFLYIRLLISHEFNTSLEGDPIGISECSLVLRKLKCLRYMAMLQYISLSWHNTEAWQRQTDRQVDVLRQCSLMWSQKIVFSGNNVYNSKHTASSVFSEPFTSTFRFFADETSYKKTKTHI